MVTVEKVRGNRVRIRGLGRFERGDRADVSDSKAAHLIDTRDDFVRVDKNVTEGDVSDSDGDVSYNDGKTVEDDDDDEADEGNDESFDVDAWLDEPYQERADRVLEGDVDEQLDLIDSEETSDTVRDAIGERRAELEE